MLHPFRPQQLSSEVRPSASDIESVLLSAEQIETRVRELAAQGVEDPTAKAAKKRMRARAGNMLDQLEKIRVGLLTGTLTIGDVINIADVVAQHREKIMDPGLTAILDEIDLRAQVEIAKMRKAMEENAG